MKYKTSHHTGLSPLCAIFAGLAITSTASFSQTTVALSEDFEAPDVSAAQSTGDTSGAVPTGWVGANQGFGGSRRGIVDKAAGGFSALDPNEQAFAFRYTNSGVTSGVGEIGSPTAGSIYTVSFDVVRDDGRNGGTPYNAQLIAFASGAARNDCRSTPAGSTVLASQTGNATNDGRITTVTFSYTAPADDPTRDLGIRFKGSTTSATIDNVQVTVTTNPAYWDINGATAGATDTPGDATGTWNGTTNWNALEDGSGATAAWSANDVATFAAGTNANGTYTVTLDAVKDINGLLFEEGTLTLADGGSGGLNLTADSDAYVPDGLSATVEAPITDSGVEAFQKTGGGTLLLNADNSGATGGMALNAGATEFATPASINGTTRNVALNSGATLIFGTGFGAGNIPAALANRVDAASAGVIAADNYAAENFDFNTPGLTAAFLGASGSVSYTGTLTPNGTTYRLGGGGGTLTMANTNALTGANSAIINGDVTLFASNDYSGGTTFYSGTLTLGNDGALGSGALTVGTGNISDGGSGITVANDIGGNLIRKIGSGTLTLSGTNTYTGGVDLDAGTLGLGSDSALGTGTLRWNANTTIEAAGNINAGNNVTYTGGNNGDVFITGSGDLTLGNFTRGDQNIDIFNDNTSGTTTFSIIQSDKNKTFSFKGDGDTTVTTAIRKTNGGAQAFQVQKNGFGTLELQGANTYTGNTTVNEGTLSLVGGSHDSAITIKTGASVAFTLGSTTASTKAITLDAGHSVVINGAVDNTSDYLLMGAIAINGTPTLSAPIADYELQKQAGDTELWLVYTGGGGAPYGTWAGTFGGLSDTNPELDFDGGGLDTGLEWVLDGDPTDSTDDAGIAPTGDNSDATYFTFTYRRSDDANADGNTTIEVEYGNDLTGWTTAVHNGTTIIITENDDAIDTGVDEVVVQIDKSLAGGTEMFVRLNVTVTTP